MSLKAIESPKSRRKKRSKQSRQRRAKKVLLLVGSQRSDQARRNRNKRSASAGRFFLSSYGRRFKVGPPFIQLLPFRNQQSVRAGAYPAPRTLLRDRRSGPTVPAILHRAYAPRRQRSQAKAVGFVSDGGQIVGHRAVAHRRSLFSQ